MTLAGPTYAEAMAWVEQQLVDHPKLQAMKHEFYTLNGQLWVQVQGAHYEMHAWHAVFGGRIFPSHIDSAGVRRQMLMCERLGVEVIDDPRKRGGSNA